MKKLLRLAPLAFLFVACAATPPEPVKVNYNLPNPIKLDVLTVTVVDRSRPYAPELQQGVDMRPTIANAIRDYVSQRITAIGTTGEAVFTIKDASLQQQAIPHDAGMFDRPQASRYVAHAEVEVRVTGRAGYGTVTGQASRFETLLKNPTPSEKQSAYNAVLNGTIHDVAANLDNGIRTHLGNFVITAPIMDDPMIPTPMPAPFTYPAR